MVSQRAIDFIPGMIRNLKKNLVLWVPVSLGIMLPNWVKGWCFDRMQMPLPTNEYKPVWFVALGFLSPGWRLGTLGPGAWNLCGTATAAAGLPSPSATVTSGQRWQCGGGEASNIFGGEMSVPFSCLFLLRCVYYDTNFLEDTWGYCRQGVFSSSRRCLPPGLSGAGRGIHDASQIFETWRNISRQSCEKWYLRRDDLYIPLQSDLMICFSHWIFPAVFPTFGDNSMFAISSRFISVCPSSFRTFVSVWVPTLLPTFDHISMESGHVCSDCRVHPHGREAESGTREMAEMGRGGGSWAGTCPGRGYCAASLVALCPWAKWLAPTGRRRGVLEECQGRTMASGCWVAVNFCLTSVLAPDDQMMRAACAVPWGVLSVSMPARRQGRERTWNGWKVAWK